jgi:Protein of unknown function (DUF1552)
MTKLNPSTHASSRRAFLFKAAGVSIGLAGLESITYAENSSGPSGSKDQKDPMRMVLMLSNLGVHPEAFFPENYGRDYTLSPTLKPIEKMRQEITVFSHMDHPSLSGGHNAIPSTFRGTNKLDKSASMVTMDQVAADHVSFTTRFPSVLLSVGGGIGTSWTKSGIKVREDSLRDLFDKLFITDQESANKARELQLKEKGSILDLVQQQAASFKRDISRSDQGKLEEYFTAIREAEVKMQGEHKWLFIQKPKMEDPAEGHPHSDNDYKFYAPLMTDLICLAIQSDSSRVFTAGFAMHNKVIELDGINNGYHNLSHHGRDPERIKQLKIIDQFYMTQYTRLVEKLKNSKTQTGSLLDKTMVFFGSSMGDASKHSNRNLPIMLAGGGFKHGTHIDCKKPNGDATPLNNLFTTMLRRFGVPIERFANATGSFDLI